jgi:hypothetical protein
MFRKSFCRVVVIAAALAVAALPQVKTASADELVPFEARIAGYAAPIFHPNGTVDNTENAIGNATHLGLCTWYSVEFAVLTGPGQFHVCGSFTLTAANGDQVFGRYATDGHADEMAFGHFEGPYCIEGGTGHFANATGSGTIRGVGNLMSPFEIVGSLSGTISQPNY